MKLRKKDFVSVGVLLIIVSIFVLSVFAVPAIYNLKENFNISKYESTKSNIINGAKSKFSASVNDIGNDDVVEYTVKELMDEGYLKEVEINPLTGEKYKDDDKVLVISKNGNLSYKFISGNTLLKEIKSSSDVKNVNNSFYYYGKSTKNYISFNEEIYRIIKVDEKNKIYIISERQIKKIEKNNIESFLNIYKNDKLINSKNYVEKVELLDSETYDNTKKDNISFIDNDNYFWLKKDNEIKVYDSMNQMYVDEFDKAWINPVIIIDNSLVIEKGNGTRLNPYVVN